MIRSIDDSGKAVYGDHARALLAGYRGARDDSAATALSSRFGIPRSEVTKIFAEQSKALREVAADIARDNGLARAWSKAHRPF
jgi:hypothetical protein